MAVTWKPTPGTGRSSAPEGSVIVNQKDTWELEEVTRCCEEYNKKKDELERDGIGSRTTIATDAKTAILDVSLFAYSYTFIAVINMFTYSYTVYY